MNTSLNPLANPERFLPFGPALQKDLNARGWTAAVLAEKSGLPLSKIEELLREHRRGTDYNTGRAIALAFGQDMPTLEEFMKS